MEVFYLTFCELVGSLAQCSVVGLIGFATLLFCVAHVLKVVVYTPFKLYYLAQVLPGVDLNKLGRWAVVTGATDGIGKGYAEMLAKKGLDVVLISRSEEKLSRVEKELKDEYGIEVRTVAVDFKRTDVYSKIKEAIEGLDVAILVNNVGMTSIPGCRFHQRENVQSLTVDMLHVNCVSMTNMCALVLPHMLAKKKGVVVNISSMGADGFIPTSVYSASKAYVSLLSECMQRTYRDSGVIIQTLETGMVDTNMANSALTIGGKPLKFMEDLKKICAVSVNSYVQSALNTIGWAEKHEGHVIHYFIRRISSLIPKASQDKWMWKEIDALQ